MDNNHPHKHKTVPIRKRQREGSSSESSADAEGTFIPLINLDSSSSRNGLDFINTRFHEHEEEDVIKVVDLQHEEKPPLFLLFPDLEKKDKDRLAATTSTTQVTQILVGKKADFSLLKPSRKLNPEQSRLPPVMESSNENYIEDDELDKE